MKKENISKIIWTTIFAIAMGFLEATVVIYLRIIYYAHGFSFPLRSFIEPAILNIEWIREIATIIMLLAIGFIAGKKKYERFAYFIYAFAVWDIFYYVFLKLALNWPSSLFDWDLLFLIPWPWVGPVIAPIICSILMIVFALIIIKGYDEGKQVKITILEWTLFIISALLILYTWLIDYGRIITLTNNQDFYNIISSYIPQSYNYLLFFIGIIIALFGIIEFYLRNRKH